MKLLDGQDFYHALASYYELAFVFQLKYSRRCQTTAELIQLKVLQYRDHELGSLTGQKKDQLLAKVRKFDAELMKA